MTERILVIKHGALGDLVQADGILRDIRQHFKTAEICLLTDKKYQLLMLSCPHIDTVITDPRPTIWQWPQQYQLWRQLTVKSFDQIIDLQNSGRSRRYQQLFFRRGQWHGRPKKAPEPATGLQGLVRLLQSANIPIAHALQPDIRWLAADYHLLLKQNNVQLPFVALIPGCSIRHPEKRWPYYAQLAAALLANGYDVVNILGPDEADLASGLPGHHLQNNGKPLRWQQLAGVLKLASFVVGNDTGPSHIASCLGTPGLAIFGPASSLERAEIRRGAFQATKVNDLHQLTADILLAMVLPRLPAPSQPPTTLRHQSNYSKD